MMKLEVVIHEISENRLDVKLCSTEEVDVTEVEYLFAELFRATVKQLIVKSTVDPSGELNKFSTKQ